MSEQKRIHQPGRHLVQVPGPTNVPASVLQAIGQPTLDHRGPAFAELAFSVLESTQKIFKTIEPVVIYPGSGTGAWEACLVNTLSPGDKVLTVETGHFANLWAQMATQLGLEVEKLPTDWRHPVDVNALAERLADDSAHEIQALLITHNETSTGTTSDIAAVRAALDAASHPALLFVDAVSALASIDYRHDEWGVDVTVAASQKGLMLPPGIAFNAVSQKAIEKQSSAQLPRAYWDWKPIIEANTRGFYPYTPPTNLLFGLQAANALLFDEGLDNVFARHRRHAEATRTAVATWGLELQSLDERAHSPVVTTIRMPDGFPEDAFRSVVLEHYGMSLGAGLGQLTGKVFRIGHLGDFDDLSLIATLAGVELGLRLAGVPHRDGGVSAALDALAASNPN